MLKRHKDLLRAIVGPLRATLAGTALSDGTWQRGDLDRELERLGIAPDGTLTPIDALPNASDAEQRARYAAEMFLAAAEPPAPARAGTSRGAQPAVSAARQSAREDVIERAAYTWINRLLALRAMEARGLIDETLRANPDYDGVSEALFILRSDAPARTAGNDGGWLAVIEDACTAQAAALPGVFDLRDPAAALRPSTAALLRCVALVGSAPNGYALAEADAAFADPDAIGWAYQFYQEAAKARVYAKLGSGGKASSRAEIAAATQLFTEPYMVQWLLQNSLGRSYHEAYPDSKLPEAWAYYIRHRPNDDRPQTTDHDGDTGSSAIVHRPSSEPPRPLHALDLIDPCCGSGHFLREAFDMFVAMYREQHAELSASEIADRVLTRHLHGIDLDPRAAQLAALTLYLRAWEFVRDDARRQRRGASSVVYRPSSLNIATTPSGLSAGALQRHLRRHPEDRVMKPLLEGVFAALEQADILGSLLRPAEHIDAAIAALQQPHTMQMDFDADDAALRRTITALANSDPAELKRMLLDRVAQSFHAEAGAADDVAAQLFGREAEGGVRLLQLLDRKYAVVVTNPPYMGSKNMEMPLKRYIEQHYPSGKRDLFAAFILRCLDLAKINARVGMVTQQSWMFLQSFVELRAIPKSGQADFPGLLQGTTLEGIAHLGRYAFSEIGNAVVAPLLFITMMDYPKIENEFWACRLAAPRPSEEQAQLLAFASQNSDRTRLDIVSHTRQASLLDIPDSPIVYWVSPRYIELLRTSKKQELQVEVKPGIVTGDNGRYLRAFWEIAHDYSDWTLYAKGGGYQKWRGFEHWVIRWPKSQARIVQNKVGRIKDETFFGKSGWNYSLMANGSLSVRFLEPSWVYDNGSPVAFPQKSSFFEVGGILQTRLASFLLRLMSQSIRFNAYYLEMLPYPKNISYNSLSQVSQSCLYIKTYLNSFNPIEIPFNVVRFDLEGSKGTDNNSFQRLLTTYLHIGEGFLEHFTHNLYSLGESDIRQLLAETGTPAGFHPLIAGYDALPELPADLELPPLPQEVFDYLAAHERIAPSPAEIQRIKARLRALYEAGPGAKEDEGRTTNDEDNAHDGDDDDEGAVSGAHIPIPTETFLEELSVKMQVHPISVYWLLEELRRDGARCKPEEQRLLEDRLSVLVLRLLGHRWPRELATETTETTEKNNTSQISVSSVPSVANRPEWADADGIIPISGGAGEHTLAERLRARLRAEDGDLGAQRAEALLQELTGQNLDDWLRREFFKRHVRQFKYRPIAWHLASDPSAAAPDARAKKRLGGRRQPAFECMVYYHACGGDVLARIRTQYVEPLLRGARQQLEQASRATDDDGVVQANMRIQELAEFNRRLQALAEGGFACPELKMANEKEPLDRWMYDGFIAPVSYEDVLRQEQAWRVDLNDGVRVNIAPVQLAGLLASDVLKAADAKKAIADRARWRSDERRWVRAGKLPRCGWMPESVPESAEWTRLATQREAERAKLEEKRRGIISPKAENNGG